MASALCQLATSPRALSFSSGFGCFMNWATQIAASLAKTASVVLVRLVPAVVQPPHAKPMIVAMIAPQMRPHIPYLIFAALSGFIDKTSLPGRSHRGAVPVPTGAADVLDQAAL